MRVQLKTLGAIKWSTQPSFLTELLGKRNTRVSPFRYPRYNGCETSELNVGHSVQQLDQARRQHGEFSGQHRFLRTFAVSY